MIGRRPNRSDSAPWIGEATNCMPAKAMARKPMISAVEAAWPTPRVLTSFGSAGKITPSAAESSSTVIRMKRVAVRRGG